MNEYAAMFTPVGEGDGNGLDYVYCGQIDKRVWFPEPALDEHTQPMRTMVSCAWLAKSMGGLRNEQPAPGPAGVGLRRG